MFPAEKGIIPLNSKANDAPLHQPGGGGGTGGGGGGGGGGASTGAGPGGGGAGGGKHPVVTKNENITIVAIRIFFISITPSYGI
ncbi:MAG: hypothetical protein H8D67_09995 [Deltaproteobacteria bacterium]|nr:hypothetical protein [Deltaproteobacteria bacterium]